MSMPAMCLVDQRTVLEPDCGRSDTDSRSGPENSVPVSVVASVPEMLTDCGLSIVHRHVLEGRNPVYKPVPDNTYSRMRRILEREYPHGLYRHQAEAIRVASDGGNVVLSTGTASGKSLAFMVPVLQDIMRDPSRCAIFIYPLRALCSDQFSKLKAFAGKLGPLIHVARVDGSVRGEEREAALMRANVIVTTPDVLHASLLKDQNRDHVARILSSLSWVVLDECHVYDGVFGSNVAHVMRRLRMACARKGSEPRFISASASIGNPAEHLKTLVGIPFQVVDESWNGCASGRQTHLFAAARDGNAERTVLRLIPLLARAGTRFMVFCDSRRMVERMTVEIRRNPELRERVSPYRSGYEDMDRLRIEKGLHEGSLAGIITTSALELGVDLPDMPVCVMIGVPKTRSAYLQRAGRIARQADSEGHVITVASGTAMDAFWFAHPQKWHAMEPEPCRLNLENPALMKGQFACMRSETAETTEIVHQERGRTGQTASRNEAQRRKSSTQDEARRRKAAEQECRALAAQYFPAAFVSQFDALPNYEWMEELYTCESPHQLLNIRAIGDPTFEIRNGPQADAPKLGSITLSQMMREACVGAVYLHRGTPYRVKRISHNKRIIHIDSRVQHGTSTTTSLAQAVRMTRKYREGAVLRKSGRAELEACTAAFSVQEWVTGIMERRGTRKTPIEPEDQLFRHVRTIGLAIRVSRLRNAVPEAVRGVANAVRNLLPILLGAGSADVEVSSTCDENEAFLFLYDNVAGGLNLSSSLLPRLKEALETVMRHVQACPDCGREGCPMCVRRPSSFRTESVDRERAILLLGEMVTLMRTSLRESWNRLDTMDRDGGRVKGSSRVDAIRDTDNAAIHDMDSATIRDMENMLPPEAESHYGRRYIRNGAEVFTSSCRFGTLRTSRVDHTGTLDGQRVYEVQFRDGTKSTFLGKGIEMVEGTLAVACGNCGCEELPLDAARCPECDAKL